MLSKEQSEQLNEECRIMNIHLATARVFQLQDIWQNSVGRCAGCNVKLPITDALCDKMVTDEFTHQLCMFHQLWAWTISDAQLQAMTSFSIVSDIINVDAEICDDCKPAAPDSEETR